MQNNPHPDPWNIHGYNAINLKSSGLPEVPLVGIHGHLATKKPLNAHCHRGAIEIHYIDKGDDDYWVEDRHYHLQNHDVILTYPHERHSTGFLGYGRQIYWMQVKLPRYCRSGLLCLDRASTQALSNALWNLPRSHFIGDFRFSQLVESIYIAERYAQPAVKKIILANDIVRLLLLCLEWAKHPAPTDQRQGLYSLGIDRVIQHIKESNDHSPDVKEMAQICNLSVSAFKAKFRKETGMPPKEFALREMVEKAKRMLASGDEQITSIGLGLGFSSSQYFATVFKRFTGMSPQEYRNSMVNNTSSAKTQPR